MKPDSTSGASILSRKIRLSILVMLSLFLVGVDGPKRTVQGVLMTPEVLSTLPQNQRVVVDTRPAWKFLLGHIPGAINLDNWREFTHQVKGV